MMFPLYNSFPDILQTEYHRLLLYLCATRHRGHPSAHRTHFFSYVQAQKHNNCEGSTHSACHHTRTLFAEPSVYTSRALAIRQVIVVTLRNRAPPAQYIGHKCLENTVGTRYAPNETVGHRTRPRSTAATKQSRHRRINMRTNRPKREIVWNPCTLCKMWSLVFCDL